MVNLWGRLVIAFGALMLKLMVKCLTDEAFLRDYLQRDRHGRLWIDLIGMENTVKLSRFVFTPLGVIVSIATIIYGVTLLFSLV